MRTGRRLVWVTGGIVAAAVGLAACSSSSSPASTTVGRRTAPTTTIPSKLKAKLLTLADLPDGWVTAPVQKSSPPTSSSDNCSGEEATDPLAGLGEAEAAFRSSASTGTVATEFFEALADTPNGPQTMAKIEKQIDACPSYTDGSGAGAATVTIAPMTFPTVGDQSAAWLLTEQGSGTTVTLPIAVVRRANEVAVFVLVDPPDQTTFTTLVQKGVAKL